eukprot:s643_g11.t1
MAVVTPGARIGQPQFAEPWLNDLQSTAPQWPDEPELSLQEVYQPRAKKKAKAKAGKKAAQRYDARGHRLRPKRRQSKPDKVESDGSPVEHEAAASDEAPAGEILRISWPPKLSGHEFHLHQHRGHVSGQQHHQRCWRWRGQCSWSAAIGQRASEPFSARHSCAKSFAPKQLSKTNTTDGRLECFEATAGSLSTAESRKVQLEQVALRDLRADLSHMLRRSLDHIGALQQGTCLGIPLCIAQASSSALETHLEVDESSRPSSSSSSPSPISPTTSVSLLSPVTSVSMTSGKSALRKGYSRNLREGGVCGSCI